MGEENLGGPLLGCSLQLGAPVRREEVHGEQDVWDWDRELGVGTCGQTVIHTLDCSAGLTSRNSCGENYIFKVGLNAFHCWKICHYGHFPLQIPGLPCPLSSSSPHCSLYFLSD